jgi:hypothetical protein
VIAMRALVVYESMFGNTREVAAAVAEGMGTRVAVNLVEVADAPTEIGDKVSLLVVGGPTHALGLSRPQTRQDAKQRPTGQAESAKVGLREWLGTLTPGGAAPLAATFDTRIRRPRMPGSAARRAERQLRRLGFEILTGPTSFWVTGTAGPLVDGERERARRWGEQIGAELVTRAESGA